MVNIKSYRLHLQRKKLINFKYRD